MKLKQLFLAGAIAALSMSAMADSSTAGVTTNGTVAPSCVFVSANTVVNLGQIKTGLGGKSVDFNLEFKCSQDLAYSLYIPGLTTTTSSGETANVGFFKQDDTAIMVSGGQVKGTGQGDTVISVPLRVRAGGSAISTMPNMIGTTTLGDHRMNPYKKAFVKPGTLNALAVAYISF